LSRNLELKGYDSVLLEAMQEDLRVEALKAENERKRLSDLMQVRMTEVELQKKELQLMVVDSYQRTIRPSTDEKKSSSSVLPLCGAGLGGLIAGLTLQQLASSALSRLCAVAGNIDQSYMVCDSYLATHYLQ